MNIGDKFFTIAYSSNTRVIEVEVIGIETIDGTVYIHFQNVEDHIDRWFIPIETVLQWKFETKEEAENELRTINLSTPTKK